MKTIKLLIALATTLFAADPLLAQTAQKIIDFPFDNGFAMNAAGANTGSMPNVFDNGGFPVDPNSFTLNFGAPTYYKGPNPNVTNNSGNQFRAVSFPSNSILAPTNAYTTNGEVILEFVVSEWNLGATNSTNVTGTGLSVRAVQGLNGGGTANNGVNFLFGVAQAPGDDIRVQTQPTGDGVIGVSGPATTALVPATNLVVGTQYAIWTQGTTDWAAFGATNTNTYTIFTSTAAGTADSGTGVAALVVDVASRATNNSTYYKIVDLGTTTNWSALGANRPVGAGYFVVGGTYTISSTGNTSFTAIGAANNNVGTTFVATGAGSGTGAATISTAAVGALFKTTTNAPSGTGKLVLQNVFPQNQLGNLGLVNTSNPTPVKVQLKANLITGNWTSRVKVGGGQWEPLVTEGQNLHYISRLQVVSQAPFASLVDTAATALVAGTSYTVKTPGDTTWTAAGAAANTNGTLFVATGPGTGTGVAVKAGSWEFNTNQGTSAEYLKLKSLALGAPDSFGKETPTVTITGTNTYYNGQPRAVTVTTIPADLITSVFYDGSSEPPTAEGTYGVEVFTEETAEYAASQTFSTLVIGPRQAINFSQSQVSANVNTLQYFTVPFSLATNDVRLPASTGYTGQPIYGGLLLQPTNGLVTGDPNGSGGIYTNGASMSFGINGGAKAQWNGPNNESEAGRYAPGDLATAVFMFKKENFLQGLNTETVSFTTASDTLAATVVLQQKSGRVAEGKVRFVVKDGPNYYISDQVGDTLVPDESVTNNPPVVLSGEALELNWNFFNVNNLNPAAGFTPATPTFANIEAIGVWLSATAGPNPGSNNAYQGLQLTAMTAGAEGSGTVTPTTPTITAAPTATSITVGQTLASSVLCGGVASVPGTFAFTAPSTGPAVGTASQLVTFTPTDTVNYTTATSSASVTVYASYANAFGTNSPTAIGANGLANLVNYALGANSPGAVVTLPASALSPDALSITATVRTNDPTVGTVGESGTNLALWIPTTIPGVPTQDQTGATPGETQKQIFSEPRGTNPKLYLRLKATQSN